MNVKSYAKVGAAVGAAVFGIGILAAPASADPNPATDKRILAGAGSDTTQYVMNGLANGTTVVNSGGAKILASWDAIPPSGVADNISTKASGCTFARSTVNGSSNGINKLIAEIDDTTTTDCVDFARSSRGVATAGTKLTFIPFAKDAVTYASRLGSTVPTNLTRADLIKLYTCTADRPAGIKPLLPQAGSGTRSFWLQWLSDTSTPITPGSCVNEGLSQAPQEHDGTALTANDQIMPYSIAQWLAQGKGLSDVPNRRGQSWIRSINSVSPTNGTGSATVLNPQFPAAREVYNVVSTARLGESAIAEAFVGAGSDVCSAASLSVIQTYGFGNLADDGNPDTNCGDTGIKGNS
ncbi:hypothetical protein ACWEQC_45430 [Streptomyces shenzhenensis]